MFTPTVAVGGILHTLREKQTNISHERKLFHNSVVRQVGGWYTCRWLVLHLYAADATDVVGGGALRDAYVSQVGVYCLYAYKCTVCKGFIWRRPLSYTRRSHSSILTPTLCLYWECSAPVGSLSWRNLNHKILIIVFEGKLFCVWLHHLA